ncbi:MAG: valine--tRNA ligase [Alphaproteobacteria bacterium]
MKQLPKTYDHKEAEQRWQQAWENSDVHHWKNDLPRAQTFVIDTPPPTVSGVLHMGHIFSYTQADFVARYQRMSGKDVFYPMGFDDNGLPTERLVEKIKGKKASQYDSREAFVADCREVVQGAEEDFRKLFKSAALSVDWRQEYQTVSDEVISLSQRSFLDMAAKNEVYRDFRPTYWDWVDQTAIAQAEIENKELPGTMNEIEFNLEDGSPLFIMTTRPELLGGCVAVMYHPEDPNASKYEGKHAITPLFGVKVPMIADEAVEREKGTGLVMCCTFGDDTDKEWWRQYKLPLRAILGKDGKLDFKNELFVDSFTEAEEEVTGWVEKIAAMQALQGLKPKQAATKTIELLKDAGKLLKQTDMVHTVKCAERSGTPIEIIPTYQWFVRVMDKKQALLAKGAECHWYPPYMQVRLNQWIEGLKEDWTISRQRFFGVPFPVWYSKRPGEEGKPIYASAEQLPVNPLVDTPKGYSRDEVTPDMDVMDTWATSSISPQINARAIHPPADAGPSLSLTEGEGRGEGDRFAKLFPADIRPQAHEIIRTWAFYTIVKAHLHTNTVPWKNLMISGWCLAADKTKMSKSKGNVITPVELIQEKGTDSVRYWASTSRLGADTAFSEDLLKIGKKLVNKLWNASNFAALNLDKLRVRPTTAAKDVASGVICETMDLWVIGKLHDAIKTADQCFLDFEYADARVAIEDFFWNSLCDNYLELVKSRAYDPEGKNPKGQQSALTTLYHCLDGVLRLFAPFVPHVTEELFSHIFDDKFAASGSLHARGMWPKHSDYSSNESARNHGDAFLEALDFVRKRKSLDNVSIKYPVERLVLQAANSSALPTPGDSMWEDLKAVGSIEHIEFTDTLKQTAERFEGSYFNALVELKPQEARTGTQP